MDKDENKLREILSNKRYRSLIILGIWLLLFTFIGISYRKNYNHQSVEENNSTTNTNNIKSILNYLNNIESYEFIYNVSKTSNYTISGTYYKEEQLINFDHKRYYLYDKLYLIDNNSLSNIEIFDDIKIVNIDLKKIYELIKNKQEDYFTDYLDNTFKLSYQVPILEFLKMYDNSNYSDSKNIEIIITGKLNSIENITLNLNNYIDNYKVEIKLENINNIKSFENQYKEQIKQE